ncbi:hypothetical protein ABPG72_001171 [Tetrahymena utriculariae]
MDASAGPQEKQKQYVKRESPNKYLDINCCPGKENTDINQQTKQTCQKNNELQLNEKAKQLQEKLKQLRENRQQAEEQKSRKNWDNVDPQIMKKIVDLEDHKRYIKTEQNEVKNNKKQILFKQRHQLMATTDVMQQKVEVIIDKEKDKLLNVFDEQLNQSRKINTPSNSFYTNSRINRSNSLDVSQYSFYSSAYIQNNKKTNTQSNQTLDISAASQAGLSNNQSSNQINIKLDTSQNQDTRNQLQNQSRQNHRSLNARLNSNRGQQITFNISQKNVKGEESVQNNCCNGNNKVNKMSGKQQNVKQQPDISAKQQNILNQQQQTPSTGSQRDQNSSLNETKKLEVSQFYQNINQSSNNSQTCRPNIFQESLQTLVQANLQQQKNSLQVSQNNYNQEESQGNSQQVKNSIHFSHFMQESFAVKQQFENAENHSNQGCLSEEQKTLPRGIHQIVNSYQGPASFLNQNNSLLINQLPSDFNNNQKQSSIHNSNTLVRRSKNQSNSEALDNDEAYWGTATNGTTISFNEDQHHSKQSVEKINFTTIYNKSDNSIQIIDERKKSDGNLMKIMEKPTLKDNHKNINYLSNADSYDNSADSQQRYQTNAFINNELKISPFQKRKVNLLNQSQSIISNNLAITCCPNCNKTLPQYEELYYDQLSNSQNSNTQSRGQSSDLNSHLKNNTQPFKNLNTFGSINEVHFKSSLLNEDSNEKMEKGDSNFLQQLREMQQKQSLGEEQHLNQKRIQELEYTIGQLYKEIEVKDDNIAWLRKQRANGSGQIKQKKNNNAEDSKKIVLCLKSQNRKLKNKIQRLETSNKCLIQENLNQQGLIQEYEYQLDNLFESIFQNEKELKQLKKQQKKSIKAFENILTAEDKVNQNFEEFKDKLERILVGYSNQLEALNQNEQYYNQITKENAILKQERDELIKIVEMNRKQI